MTTVDLDIPARALAIGAHPDDVEFGCGATLAKWSGAGCETHLLVLTDGSKGTWDADADLEALVATRRQEQRAAADRLGITDVHELSAVDGELEATIDGRALVCAVIREVRPTVLLGHDPWKRYRLHPDHRHAGFLTVDALVAARDHHFFPEQGLAPHRPDALLLFEADEPDHVERVEATIDAKVEALLAHRSQWNSTLGIDESLGTERVAEQRRAFVDRIRAQAIEAGALGGVALGEDFKRLEDL